MMALKNFHEQKSNPKIREFRGTLISSVSDIDHLNFLTSDGTYYHILKNKKYHQLHLLSGESLKVSAFVQDLHLPGHTLAIESFDIDFAEDTLADDEKIDDIVLSVPEDTFIDYESFNS